MRVTYRDRLEAIWQLLDAFAAGYFEHIQPSRREVEALPALLLRRRIVVNLHWAGRWRVGLATESDVRERLDATFRLTNWLEEHGDALVGRLLDRA